MSAINDNRTQELNDRIIQRNIVTSSSSHHLERTLNFRPVSTKYMVLPIIDDRKIIPKHTTFHNTLNKHFDQEQPQDHVYHHTGDRSGPWSNFSSNIDVESTLRSQFFAIQKNDQAVYIPSSNSDLYRKENYSNNQDISPHILLFKKEEFDSFNPTPIEEDQHLIFNNFTRNQLQDINNLDS